MSGFSSRYDLKSTVSLQIFQERFDGEHQETRHKKEKKQDEPPEGQAETKENQTGPSGHPGRAEVFPVSAQQADEHQGLSDRTTTPTMDRYSR